MNKSVVVILGLIVVGILAYFLMQGGAAPSASEDAMMEGEMMEDDAMMEGEVDVEADAMME